MFERFGGHMQDVERGVPGEMDELDLVIEETLDAAIDEEIDAALDAALSEYEPAAYTDSEEWCSDSPEWLDVESEAEAILNQAFPDAPAQRSGQSAPLAPLWQEALRFGLKLAGIAAAFALLLSLVYGLHRNTDPDMSPMVKDGDLVLFYRLDKEYAIRDILVLNYQGERQVRRVAARAGDTVDITEQGLVINGARQQEGEIYEETQRYADIGVSFPLILQEGQLFVLGDARENAADSRIYGPVETKDTLGKVITVMRRRSF